jgi:hypothetical protein
MARDRAALAEAASATRAAGPWCRAARMLRKMFTLATAWIGLLGFNEASATMPRKISAAGYIA